jgi:hypothetical protein
MPYIFRKTCDKLEENLQKEKLRTNNKNTLEWYTEMRSEYLARMTVNWAQQEPSCHERGQDVATVAIKFELKFRGPHVQKHSVSEKQWQDIKILHVLNGMSYMY